MGLTEDLVEKRGLLKKKQDDLKAIFDEAGPDRDFTKITLIDGDTVQKAKTVRDRNQEINDLADEVKSLVDAYEASEQQKKREEALEAGGLRDGFRHRGDLDNDDLALYGQKGVVDIGKMFVESDAYKKMQSDGSGYAGPATELKGVDTKTLMTTSAGWGPESIRTGRVVEKALRPIQVIDLFPMGRTSMTSVKYMEETTATNNAAETAEAATYPESALALTERTSPVQKIATFLPVTDEQLEDVVGIQSYVNNRLTFFLRQRFDSQLLVGDGISPNLKGVLNVSGIQTQARGADPGPDAIYKAMTLIRVTGRALPDGIAIHPTNWQTIKLLRTADGIYIWGNPADASPDRIWGMNVALTDGITLNTALVGDFTNFSEILMKRDIEVQISNSHSTFFIEGKQAIRADFRCAFVVYRPAAFCTVTSLT